MRLGRRAEYVTVGNSFAFFLYDATVVSGDGIPESLFTPVHSREGRLLIFDVPPHGSPHNTKGTWRVTEARGDPRLVVSGNADQLACPDDADILRFLEVGDGSREEVHKYFSDEEANYYMYIASDDPLQQYRMWRFDYARLQHSFACLDFDDPEFVFAQPLLV